MDLRAGSGARRRFLVAHRAGNDLEHLRRAENLGVTLVEGDVRLYRGRAEVRHLKTIGPLPILWDRWRLGNPFARRLVLAELLDALSPGTELMLDLKGRDVRLARLVLQALRTHRVAAPLAVCARSPALLEPFRGLVGVHAVLSIGSRRQLHALERRFDGRRLDGISIHERLLDHVTVQRLASYADVVMTWPVRTVEQANRLLGWGVQGLISDAPEELAQVVLVGTAG